MEKLLLLVVTARILHLVRAGCPSDWVKNDGNCYYFQGTKTTYTQAPFYCDSLGGAFFAVPRSASENDFIGSNVKYAATWLAAVRPISNPRQEYGQYANYDSTVSGDARDGTLFAVCSLSKRQPLTQFSPSFFFFFSCLL